MPQQTDSAVPVLVGELSEMKGRKVRVVGWMLAYEDGEITLVHGDARARVDVTACLGPDAMGARGLSFLGERKRKVMAIGHVEQTAESSPWLQGGANGSDCVLRAVLVREVDGLDLQQWREGVAVREDTAEKARPADGG